MQQLVLLGAESIAQGALDSGISGVYAYPGTPSTEITEYIQKSRLTKEKGIHSAWSIICKYLSITGSVIGLCVLATFRSGVFLNSMLLYYIIFF